MPSSREARLIRQQTLIGPAERLVGRLAGESSRCLQRVVQGFTPRTIALEERIGSEKPGRIGLRLILTWVQRAVQRGEGVPPYVPRIAPEAIPWWAADVLQGQSPGLMGKLYYKQAGEEEDTLRHDQTEMVGVGRIEVTVL
jgi:hypothetical protein